MLIAAAVSRFAFSKPVGMYYPVQGMLRSVLIPSEHRATVSHPVHTMTCANHHIAVMTDILIVLHSAEHIPCRLIANWSIYGATSSIYHVRRYLDFLSIRHTGTAYVR